MSKSVLLVDDDKVLNFLTANALKRSEHVTEVLVAYDGNQALNLLDELDEPLDFILLDISMPNMDGFEFLTKYYDQGLNSQAKIAIYTSSIEDADKKKAAKFKDVIDFIIKPLSNKKLDKILAEL
ncbi:MAG: CheY-like chemotaxis protein [Glaciecola sp.]|jgi:CheY-like chemotaxis protein